MRRQRLIQHWIQVRQREQAQMDAYRQHTGCLMEFLARSLDDPAAAPCGHCAPCKGQAAALRAVPEELAREAVVFLRRCDLPIDPRTQWMKGAMPTYDWSGSIAKEHRAETGRALCILTDSGWGGLVGRGKYQDGRYAEELVEALATLVRSWQPTPAPSWVTSIPSLAHPQLVLDLAQRLAARLGLLFMPAVRKLRPTKPQKDMENSWQQARNLDGAFQVEPWNGLAGPVLLVDDIVDSRWTFTVTAALLRQAGSGRVFPLALAANR
jgi:ATP-dependent DNA helicase RecQ